MSEWTKCEDAEPERVGWCFVWLNVGGPDSTRDDKIVTLMQWRGMWPMTGVEQWMPVVLPEPPEAANSK